MRYCSVQPCGGSGQGVSVGDRRRALAAATAARTWLSCIMWRSGPHGSSTATRSHTTTASSVSHSVHSDRHSSGQDSPTASASSEPAQHASLTQPRHDARTPSLTLLQWSRLPYENDGHYGGGHIGADQHSERPVQRKRCCQLRRGQAVHVACSAPTGLQAHLAQQLQCHPGKEHPVRHHEDAVQALDEEAASLRRRAHTHTLTRAPRLPATARACTGKGTSK